MLDLLFLALTLGGSARAQSESESGSSRGGLEIGTGLRGTLSQGSLAILLPRPVPNMDLRIGGTAMSATTWATFHDADTGEVVSVHPVVVGGTLYVGGSNRIVHDLMRTYGGFEVLLGHSFTPYEVAFYGGDNRIGPNLTVGLAGTFGVEFFAGPHNAFFIDGGGGIKTYRGLVDNQAAAVVATSWLGSGACLKVGTRLYL